MPTVDPTIFKAYDIRGVYPDQLQEDIAHSIGRAFVVYLEAKRVAVARDMRLSSPSLAAAFIDGARDQGADVIDFGMLGTDMLYYAVARDDLDGGAMVTASHNPKQYNGMKLVRRQALPLSGDAGISDIREMILGAQIPPPTVRGSLTEQTILNDYIGHILSFIDPSVLRPFQLVLDAGSGMGGLVAPSLFDKLPCRTTRLCFDIDGTFPNHQANPLLEENRQDLVAQVRTDRADAGVAWDGDADRCFFVDGQGEFIAGDFVTALLAEAFLLKTPGATIIYDVRASYAVKEIVQHHGGRALMNRVGHAFFKTRMREEDAVFGGEVTGHYYFRGELLRGQRIHPGAPDLGAHVGQEHDAQRATAPASREVLHLGRDQHRDARHGRSRRHDRRLGDPVPGRAHLPDGRRLRRVSDVALQRPPVEHRTPHSAQLGSDEPGADGRKAR